MPAAPKKRRPAPRNQKSSSGRSRLRSSRAVSVGQSIHKPSRRGNAARAPIRRTSRTRSESTGSLSGIWPLAIWTILSVVVLLLLYRTLLPIIFTTEWLAGEDVSQERVILITADSHSGWAVLHLLANSTDSAVFWLTADQLSQLPWAEYTLENLESESGESERLDSVRLDELLNINPSAALIEISQNTGIAVSDHLRVESDEWDPLTAAAEARHALSRALWKKSWGLGWRDMVMNARIWHALQGFRTTQAVSPDRISLSIQNQRRANNLNMLQECTLAILNGTRIGGLSARMSRLSEQQGFSVVRVGQAEELSEFSELIISPDYVERCQTVVDVMLRFLPATTRVSEESGLTTQYRSPLVVVLGSDVGTSKSIE